MGSNFKCPSCQALKTSVTGTVPIYKKDSWEQEYTRRYRTCSVCFCKLVTTETLDHVVQQGVPPKLRQLELDLGEDI
jgi:transcriptional regulator NrdR family protein